MNLNPAPVTTTAEDVQEVAADLRKLIDSAPASIWLDLGEDFDTTLKTDFRDLREVSWSADNATGVGIKYVRAPVAVATSDAERVALLEEAAEIAMGGWHSVEKARAFACAVSNYLSALPIDFKQATELLAMFGGEPGEVTLLTGEGHSGRGLYAHATGHGEDGAEFLGMADDEAAPEVSKQATDQGGTVLPPSFAKLADAKTLAKVLKMNLVSGVLAPLAAELCQSLEEMVLATEGCAIAAPTLLGVADGDAVGGKSGEKL